MRFRRRKGRPTIPRIISEEPKIKVFMPLDEINNDLINQGHENNTLKLTLEELESIRLVDYLGYSQEEGAMAMGVSRRVFWNILKSARAKISDFLINGKILRIEGGNYRIRECDK
ncbi:DUF134 domain-containing protein [Methanothermococcus sp. SCGC AD-155-M21]|nr:DUF134 domain-containing protein [Methanothermococcus sp. SCGC AD-155-M21]